MRVLHLFQTLTGGSATYLEEIAQAQRMALGDENVGFFIPREHRDQVPNIPDDSIIGFRRRGRTPLGLMEFWQGCATVIRRFAPDILHLHSSFPGAFGRLPFLLGRKRPRIVYCAHGWSFDREQARWKTELCGLVERSLSAVTDAIINVSEYDLNLSLRYGIPREKSRVILNGVSDRLGQASRKPCDACEDIRVVFVGRFDRQKGLDILMKSLSDAGTTGLKLDILGGHVVDRPGQALPNLENATYRGWASRERVADFIRQADVVVIPSRWEAFGLVAVEAMMLETAVLASNRGGLPEVVQDGVSGRIFDLSPPSQIPQILRETTKAEWATMGLAGRKRYEQKFTAARMNADLLQLYHSMWRET